MAKLSPVFNDAQLDGNGDPIEGARLFTWLVGSFTKRTVFTNAAESASHSNPIVLNFRGEPPSPIYIPAGVTLRFGLAPKNDLADPPTVLIRDIDNVQGVNDLGVTTISEWQPSGLIPTFISATSFTVPGDQTNELHSRRRIRTQNSGGTVFSTIVSSVFTTLTTVAVVSDGIGVLDSGISSLFVGIISAVNTSAPMQGRPLKNLIWNGSMECWQDGTSETGVTASSNRVADGFRFNVLTHGTWTLDRSTTVPTVAQAGRNFNFSHRFLCTTADTTVAAGDFALGIFTVEGFDYQDLFQQPQFISFWVQASVTGTYCVSLRNSGLDRSYVATYTINAANVWERKAIPITATPSGGTFDFNEGIGIMLGFAFASGGALQTTADAWQTGNFIATSAQVNLAGTVNNQILLTDIRLHGGSSDSQVYVRSFPETIQEAQRRFWKSFDYATKPAQNAGAAGSVVYTTNAAGATSFIADVKFREILRAVPTLTGFNPASASATWRNIALSANSAAIVFADTATNSTRVSNAQVAGDAANHGMLAHITADARFVI